MSSESPRVNATWTDATVNSQILLGIVEVSKDTNEGGTTIFRPFATCTSVQISKGTFFMGREINDTLPNNRKNN